MGMMEFEPLLSIVIPVYNSEKYLQRCLDSVRHQTYRNIEIILVDDGSPGPIKEMMNAPENSDIKFVSHGENKGLFWTRITGSLEAKGMYIAFLDSDDFVSKDFYRTLISKAVIEDLDIVAGKTIFRKSDGTEYIRNLNEIGFGTETIRGHNVKKRFFEQAGSCFVWHTIWNKIYRKSLWDACVPFYKKMSLNTIMTEDVAFSSLLFYNAESFAYVPNEGIRYCDNKGSSTDSLGISLEKFLKNVRDMTNVFDFVQDYLSGVGADKKIQASFLNFRKFYSRLWRSLQEERFTSGEEQRKSLEAIDNFLPNYKETSFYEEHYFEIFETPYDPTMESIKNIIIDDKIEVVSFDIFDTLVIRPFYKADDLFLLMNKEYGKENGSCSPFSFIRKKAEENLRLKWWKTNPDSEDFPLKSIYENMTEFFGIPRKTAERMYALEKSLEIKYCYERKSAKDLYELADYLGKRVILISDMYLEYDTVSDILKKNGYDKHEKLFLSSKEGKLKYSGKLYECALSHLNVSPDRVVHIGDNWKIDFEMSQKLGFVPVFLPRTIESMENKIQNVPTNNLGFITDPIIGRMASSNQLKKSLNYRTLISLIANEYFDNPYVSYNSQSDLNISPRLIGLYPLGMHLVALCRHILMVAENNKSEKIVLLSRDGYLLHEALTFVSKFIHAPEIDYVPCSRNALLPWMVCSISDLYDLPINIPSHSPASVSALLNFCSTNSLNEIRKMTGYNDFWDERFQSFNEFSNFIKSFISHCYSTEKHDESKKIVAEFYKSRVPENAVVFDMGYSGRVPAALSKALDYKANYVYVCSDSDSCNQYYDNSSTEIETIYPILPQLSGFLREYFLSEQGGPCLGFKTSNEKIEPIFERIEQSFTETFAIRLAQKNALDLVNRYFLLFGEYMDIMKFDPFRESLPFESMICNSKDADMAVFMTSYSDDYIYGRVEKLNVYNFWKSITCANTDKTEQDIIYKQREEREDYSAYEKKIDISSNKIVRAAISFSYRFMNKFGFLN
jgi:HAD superfamily hydrolase (TIGR01549 family)